MEKTTMMKETENIYRKIQQMRMIRKIKVLFQRQIKNSDDDKTATHKHTHSVHSRTHRNKSKLLNMRRWRCGAYSLKGIHRTRLYPWITMQWMKQHEKHDTNMHRAAITFIQINRTKTRDDEDPTECKCFFQDFECFFSLFSVVCAVLCAALCCVVLCAVLCCAVRCPALNEFLENYFDYP